VVISYILFFLLFILRSSLSGYFWNICVWFALLGYSANLYVQLKNYVPTSFNMLSIVQFFNLLSMNQNSQYLLYSIIIYQSHHISTVALFPLAVYALLNSSDFFGTAIVWLCAQFPNTITGTIRSLYSDYTQERRNFLLFFAAAAEVLTFPILLWRWISGVSHEISIIHIFLLGQFLYNRKSVSEHTQRFINAGYTTYSSILRSWFNR